MSTLLRDTLDEVLYETIMPGAFPTSMIPTALLDFVEEDATDIAEAYGTGGRYFYTYFKLKTRYALGGGPRGMNKALPAHANPAWDTGQVNLCNWYQTGEYVGPVELIKDSAQVVDGLADMMKDVKKGIQYGQNALITGNNLGCIAKINGVPVDNGSTVTYTCIDNNLWPGARRLRPGIVIDLYDGTTGAGTNTQTTNSIQVDEVTPTTFTLTEGSTSGADTNYVFFEDGHGTNVDNVAAGLPAIVDGIYTSTTWLNGSAASNFEGIDGASVGMWRANISYDATARYLTPELIDDGVALIEDAYMGSWDDMQKEGAKYVFMSRPQVQRRFMKDMQRNITFTAVTKDVAGIATLQLPIRGKVVPWVTDSMLPGYQAMLVNAKDIVWKALPVRDLDKGRVERVTNFDVYRKQFGRHFQLGCVRRNTHCKWLNLSE